MIIAIQVTLIIFGVLFGLEAIVEKQERLKWFYLVAMTASFALLIAEEVIL